MPVTVYGKLERIEERISSAQNIPYLYMVFSSETSGVEFSASLFRQSYLYNYYAVGVGKMFIVAGKLQYDSYRGMYQITPELISYDNSYARRVVPVFHAVKGISKKMIEKIMTAAVRIPETDFVPEQLRRVECVEELNTAIKDIAFPRSMDRIELAQRRFVVDDLYRFAYRMEQNRLLSANDGMKIASTDMTESIIASLPYSLTTGQRNAVDLMIERFKEGAHFKALVQGDVGCG